MFVVQVYGKVYYVLLFKMLLSVGKERMLKGAWFFVVFFFLFATAVYLIPTPMFPGYLVLSVLDAASMRYASFLSALINGITYGLIAWAVFAFAMRKIGATESKPEPESKSSSERQPKSDGAVRKRSKPKR